MPLHGVQQIVARRSRHEIRLLIERKKFEGIFSTGNTMACAAPYEANLLLLWNRQDS